MTSNYSHTGEPFFTPCQIADDWGTSEQRVRQLIVERKLAAINLGSDTRPRWKVPQSSLQAFVQERLTVAQQPKKEQRRSRTLKPTGDWV